MSVALGELVRREMGRRQRRTASDEQAIRLALEDARTVADELHALIARFERHASATGASRS